MHRSKLEILVGLFVILALVILAFMVFFISGVYFFKQGYHINVVFNSVSNLEKGASVRFGGIPVGNVSELALQYDASTGHPRVKTVLFLDNGLELREGAQIRIEGIYGLMTPHVEIKTGGDPKGKLLREGDSINGLDPMSMDDLIENGQKISEDLEESITRVNRFMADPEVINSLRGTLINMNALTATMNDLLQNKQANVVSAINELEAASQNLRAILEKVNSGQGTAGKLISDEALYKEIEDFVKDLKRHPWKLLKKGDDDEDGKKKKTFGIF